MELGEGEGVWERYMDGEKRTLKWVINSEERRESVCSEMRF